MMVTLQVQVFVGRGSKERSLNFQKGTSYTYTLIMLEYDFYLKKKKCSHSNLLIIKLVPLNSLHFKHMKDELGFTCEKAHYEKIFKSIA